MIRCVKMMKVIYANIDKLLEQMDSMHDDAVMKRMQEINNDLSMAIKSYGTESLEDLTGCMHWNKQRRREQRQSCVLSS